jgi:hypothetical protein
MVTSAERTAEQAIKEFEENKQRLYRRDGSQVYSEAEHEERLESATAQLREKIGKLIERAENTAAGPGN